MNLDACMHAFLHNNTFQNKNHDCHINLGEGTFAWKPGCWTVLNVTALVSDL